MADAVSKGISAQHSIFALESNMECPADMPDRAAMATFETSYYVTCLSVGLHISMT